ncbi:MAG: hexameric tyrosine-coordinated heme protein [Actinomycetota bacterium]
MDLIPTLITDTPAEGRELAIMMARKTIASMQGDADVRSRLRPDYAESSEQLIAAGQVVATEFATIAAANNYWR